MTVSIATIVFPVASRHLLSISCYLQHPFAKVKSFFIGVTTGKISRNLVPLLSLFDKMETPTTSRHQKLEDRFANLLAEVKALRKDNAELKDEISTMKRSHSRSKKKLFKHEIDSECSVSKVRIIF